MSRSTLALPVSVEQIAVAIKQMSQEDQRRLLQLVPDLSQLVRELPAGTIDAAWANVEQLRRKLIATLDNQPISIDEPFLGGLSFAQYDALPDPEKAELWDQSSEIDLMALEEREIDPNALSTR